MCPELRARDGAPLQSRSLAFELEGDSMDTAELIVDIVFILDVRRIAGSDHHPVES